MLCNSFRWDKPDAKVRIFLFQCFRAEGQRQIQQKRTCLELNTVTTQELRTTLEDVFLTKIIVAFENYNFICRIQKTSESLD